MSGEFVHRLGMAVSAAAALLCTAMAVAEARRERAARRRATRALGAEAERGRRRARAAPRGRWLHGARATALRRWLPAVAIALSCVALVGGIWGGALGLAAAYGVTRWQRRDRAVQDGPARHAGRVAPQLPLAADLLAACLAAGAGPREAAEAVGRSLRGPVGERLAQAAAELRLGGDPAHAWGRLAALPGAGPLARCLERAGATGSPVVETVSRLAADCRAEQGREATERAGKARARAVIPLGLCFLPAFLLIAVVPVVIGLTDGLSRGI
ncbi:type II secretion system F family protein [Streptomyces sp. LX-29]|uniref:type II secretion system F family protein n=1 Tax=Streptomyces sp. LX-29 TaxID=2900152 RepID=UPI00240E5229|nr:type II secretion system F family protein [Streptomyces sp. LX-29]WFB08224.1 type II secretion system F family protein [Streptomyces sp. LX-29]